MVAAMNRRRRPAWLGLLLILLCCYWISAAAAAATSTAFPGMAGSYGPSDGFAFSKQTLASVSSALAFASPSFEATTGNNGAARGTSRQKHHRVPRRGSPSSSVAICSTAFETRLSSQRSNNDREGQSNLWNDFWSNLQNRGSSTSTSRTSSNPKGRKRTKQQQQFIDELLALTAQSSSSSTLSQEQRVAIDAAIANLAAVSPIAATAMALQLQQTWQLLWTTEKEINLFVQQGWTTSSTSITQTIARGDDENDNMMNDDDGGPTILTNNIPLDKIDNGRGSFSVTGRLYRQQQTDNDGSADADNADSPMRTRFEFQAVQLNLGKWGTYSLPPVGKGWFDTVYLDDTFRVDVNSRNDILICQAE